LNFLSISFKIWK